jgi:anti-sigma B factor antagonist
MTMATPTFRIVIEQAPGRHLVHLIGELDVASAERTRHTLVAVTGSEVVIDLAGLDFVDAAGLGALVDARASILAAGDECTLSGATGLVRRVFELCGLDQLLADRDQGR